MDQAAETRPKRFAITGVTVSGNMGGAAMLHASLDAIRSREPDARFCLLSVTPGRDRELPPVPGLDIVSAHYLLLLMIYFPLSLLLWPLRHILPLRRLLSPMAYFKALADADVIVDLAGIAFVDGRGAAVLAYNCACCLPAQLLGQPVVKLAQALGPFETFPNRQLAHFVLSRCRAVVARGAISEQRLLALGIDHAIRLPDVSFALQVRPSDREKARGQIAALSLTRPLVVISPSEVVRRIVDRGGGNFADMMAELINVLSSAGYAILLLPHSLASGKTRNNDRDLCKAIAARVDATRRPAVMDGVNDPRLLRALIGEADGFIGCRFHAAVAALSMAVPSLIVGWGHKYKEMAEGLISPEWVIDARQFSPQQAFQSFQAVMSQRNLVIEGLRQRLPDVEAEANRNFDFVVAAAHG
jgi:polysaccharide pyruvyl transferase WcaK-like protein